MTKSSKEYVAAHRARKAAKAFSNEYLNKRNVVTPEEFIAGKQDEICIKFGVSHVEFNSGTVNDFYSTIKDRYEPEDGLYVVDDLMVAWKEADAMISQEK